MLLISPSIVLALLGTTTVGSTAPAGLMAPRNKKAPRSVRRRKPHLIDFILLFIVLVSALARKVCSVGQFGPLLFALSRIKLTKLRLLVRAPALGRYGCKGRI